MRKVIEKPAFIMIFKQGLLNRWLSRVDIDIEFHEKIKYNGFEKDVNRHLDTERFYLEVKSGEVGRYFEDEDSNYEFDNDDLIRSEWLKIKGEFKR